VIVRGRLQVKEGTLVHYFKRVGMHQQLRKLKDPKATRAELRYRVDQELADASLVRVELVTGLQNQIRAQFLAAGHPVIGDRKYHPEEAGETRIDRVALHAARLEFEHPRTRKKIVVESKPPEDFQRLVRALSRS
jgi:23S rRNA-/tRNA-specific pseudouridylate synthase